MSFSLLFKFKEKLKRESCEFAFLISLYFKFIVLLYLLTKLNCSIILKIFFALNVFFYTAFKFTLSNYKFEFILLKVSCLTSI